MGLLSTGYQFIHLLFIRSIIKWDGNYWNEPRSIPKPILGAISLVNIPFFQIDWHPAKQPYNITTTQGCDII